MSEALIAELARRPDDVELVRVFADWLLEQGHPAGELANVQLARLAGDSAALAEREQQVLWNAATPHLRRVLGREQPVAFTWRGGLLDTVTIDHIEDEDFVEPVRRLAHDPCGRLVRRVEIVAAAGDVAAAVRALTASPFPRLAELVVLARVDLGERHIGGAIHVGALAAFCAAYPGFEVLELRGTTHELGALSLPALRRLAITAATPDDIAALATAELPALADLELGHSRPGADMEAAVRPLLDRVRPSLSRLVVSAAAPRMMQYLAHALPGSALARHARSIAFRGAVDDITARVLVQWASRLRALEELEVDGRGLSREARHVLVDAFRDRLVLP